MSTRPFIPSTGKPLRCLCNKNNSLTATLIIAVLPNPRAAAPKDPASAEDPTRAPSREPPHESPHRTPTPTLLPPTCGPHWPPLLAHLNPSSRPLLSPQELVPGSRWGLRRRFLCGAGHRHDVPGVGALGRTDRAGLWRRLLRLLLVSGARGVMGEVAGSGWCCCFGTAGHVGRGDVVGGGETAPKPEPGVGPAAPPKRSLPKHP